MPEDRQSLITDVNVPRQTDRHAAGTAQGPPEQGYVKVSGFSASAAVATKTVTLTITPGTNAPVVAGATVDYVTDWGDGAGTTGTATNPAHTYAAAGPQSITVMKRVTGSDGRVLGTATTKVAATTT